MKKLLFLLLFMGLFVGCATTGKPLVQMDAQLAKFEAQAEEINALKAEIRDLTISFKAQVTARLKAELRLKVESEIRAEAKINAQGNIGQGNTNTAQEFEASGENSKIVNNDTNIFKWWAIFATIMLLAVLGILGKITAARSKAFRALIRVIKKEEKNV